MNADEIVGQILDSGWPTEAGIVEFAVQRRGYMGDDGYYGVTYASDLDDYDRSVEGRFIEPDHIELTYWDGEAKSITVPELAYLRAILDHLKSHEDSDLVEKVQTMIVYAGGKGS